MPRCVAADAGGASAAGPQSVEWEVLAHGGCTWIRQLGRGQYGTAHLVVTREGVQAVAKVVFLDHLRDRDRALALQEVEVLRKLRHPNIVRHFASWLHRGGQGPSSHEALVNVMEFCAGGDLHEWLDTCSRSCEHLTEAMVLDLFGQMLRGIRYTHTHKVLHRDLKTSNMLLDAEHRAVKIGDFGIARVLDNTAAVAVTMLGTPYYMSPEVCKGEPYREKSDMWSLGCVLYEMCVLRHAFESQSLLGLVYCIVSENFDPISSERYSSGVRQLVEKLLSKSADERPSAAEALILDVLRPYGGPEEPEDTYDTVQEAAPELAPPAPAPEPEPVAPEPVAAPEPRQATANLSEELAAAAEEVPPSSASSVPPPPPPQAYWRGPARDGSPEPPPSPDASPRRGDVQWAPGLVMAGDVTPPAVDLPPVPRGGFFPGGLPPAPAEDTFQTVGAPPGPPATPPDAFGDTLGDTLGGGLFAGAMPSGISGAGGGGTVPQSPSRAQFVHSVREPEQPLPPPGPPMMDDMYQFMPALPALHRPGPPPGERAANSEGRQPAPGARSGSVFDEVQVLLSRLRGALLRRPRSQGHWLQAFALHDTTGQGCLGAEEFPTFLASLSVGLSREEVQRIADHLQGRSPGPVTLGSFSEAVERSVNTGSFGEAWAADASAAVIAGASPGGVAPPGGLSALASRSELGGPAQMMVELGGGHVSTLDAERLLLWLPKTLDGDVDWAAAEAWRVACAEPAPGLPSAPPPPPRGPR